MYAVRLEKAEHVFSAAHFITYSGNVCERLHGHNYRVAVEVEGPLDENHYVIDFIALRDEVQRLLREWDHRMLLPSEHPLIRVVAGEREVEAVFTPDGRRWVFPREDCVLLPVPNTTAEKLAELLAHRLHEAIVRWMGVPPARLRVAVDENQGQWGICEITPARGLLGASH